MPARSTPLVTNEIYHVMNRGNASIPIFRTKYDYQKFIQLLVYYQNSRPPVRFSKFIRLNGSEKDRLLEKFRKTKDFLVEMIAFCLMPNHFHMILKQSQDLGILNFIRLTTNSYSRHFNIKYRRKGGLFEGRFKAVRIETDEQLLHVSRYIHLNPYSSCLVKNFNELLKYPFSSFPEYLGEKVDGICQREIITEQFSANNRYKGFVLDGADYQRTLEDIKHQTLED